MFMAIMGAQMQVLAIQKKLERGIRQEADKTQALDLLRALQDLPINLVILANTRIGKTVNQLRRGTDDKQVNTLARSLIKMWKMRLLDNRDRISNNASQGQVSHKRKNGNQDEESLAAKKPKLESIDKPTPNPSVNNPISLTAIASFPPVTTTDSVRLRCRELLMNAVTGDGHLPDAAKDPQFLAEKLEEQIFNEIKNTGLKYKNQVRSRVANLKDTKNPNLRRNFLVGRIGPSRLAKMTAEEMASDELKDIRFQFANQAIIKAQLATDLGTETDLLKCVSCKARNCTFRLLVRCDERRGSKVTRICFCCSCGQQWKERA